MQRYQDKQLTCVDCGATFVFTANEQQLFAERGYTNEPKRCLACRDSRRARRPAGPAGGSNPDRQMYPAVCASCGKETQVPFEPRQGRPVYCRDCYMKSRGQR
jgi:CxxC-x17-CxxC domain-containing protein